jgi:hypothetical protein
MLSAFRDHSLRSIWLLVLAVSTFAVADEPEKSAEPVDAKIESFRADQVEHWAYQPLQRPEPPGVQEADWARNPIDQFILAELEAAELPHSTEADRVALIRRLTFDLTGLPPSLEEVAAFLADRRTDAYERLVDRLLLSPHYGERWAQHWLDLAHYADSNGFELDAERPDAWRYRDWVVKALNQDMPYNRFVSLQIAGDELLPGDPEGLIATGFGRCGPREVVGGNIIPEVRRQNELTEITSTVGSVFLGLTIGCARCHDHKFDAIPTTDYYRLQSFFAASQLVDPLIAEKSEVEAYQAAKKAIDAKLAPLKKQMETIEEPYRKRLTDQKYSMLTPEERVVISLPEPMRSPEQKKIALGLQTSLRITWEEVAEEVAKQPEDYKLREALKREIDAIERTMPRPPAHAMALIDQRSEAPDTFVFRRGEYRNKGPRVTPRPPGVLLASHRKSDFSVENTGKGTRTTGRRSALARWLTSDENPLAARVIANRIWQHHFTRGIVATPSDFGVRGEEPSHAELLDWLASELIANGWRLKPIHRLIVTSATYRQTSTAPEQLVEQDPNNTLLGRMNRRRLDAESLRDAMLAASGELSSKKGGPGVLAPLEKEVKDLIFTEAEVVDLWPVDRDPREHVRRSLYLFRKRNVRYPLLESFDSPDAQFPCPRRENSTHALQALNLLNSDFSQKRALALANRLLDEPAACDADRIQAAYQRVLCRPARPEELRRAIEFLAAQTELIKKETPTAPSRLAAWTDLALALLNCNEFLYIP